MNIQRTVLFALVLALAVTVASAQGTGSLVVKVIDSDGAPLPGATVTISHNAGNIKTTSVLADKKGWAQFPVLRPGPGYVIEVEFPGFGKRREAGIRVQIGKESTYEINLAAEHTERVKVVASSDVVRLEETHSSTKFSDEFIQDLPVPGRFYQNVLNPEIFHR